MQIRQFRETFYDAFSRAISLLLKDFPLPNDATFAELKRSLRSDQASAIGMHVSKIGSAIAANLKGGNQYDAAVDEMIFMLIGASLWARSGSRAISLEHEQSIDKMIAIAEEAEANQESPGSLKVSPSRLS